MMGKSLNSDDDLHGICYIAHYLPRFN